MKKTCIILSLTLIFLIGATSMAFGSSAGYTFTCRGTDYSNSPGGTATSTVVIMHPPTNSAGRPYITVTVDGNTSYSSVQMYTYWATRNFLGVYNTKASSLIYSGNLGNSTASQLTVRFDQLTSTVYTFTDSSYKGTTYFRFKCKGANSAMYFEFSPSFENWTH